MQTQTTKTRSGKRGALSRRERGRGALSLTQQFKVVGTGLARDRRVAHRGERESEREEERERGKRGTEMFKIEKR